MRFDRIGATLFLLGGFWSLPIFFLFGLKPALIGPVIMSLGVVLIAGAETEGGA